jgi:hypothetical protein
MEIEMKKIKPTHTWREWQEENETHNISDQSIDSMDLILDAYIKKLNELKNPNKEEIMSSLILLESDRIYLCSLKLSSSSP